MKWLQLEFPEIVYLSGVDVVERFACQAALRLARKVSAGVPSVTAMPPSITGARPGRPSPALSRNHDNVHLRASCTTVGKRYHASFVRSSLRANRSLIMTRSKKTAAPVAETVNILAHWHDAVPHDRLAHLVKDAMRSLVRALQMRLTEHEVSFGHWTFLRILWEMDGLTQRELSAQAGVMEPTTFAAVKAMETLGYVSRQQLPDNKKNVHVFLTRKGRALKKKLVPLAEEVNDISVARLTKRDIQIARKVLLTIIENLAADESRSDNPTHRMPSTRELGQLIAERGEALDDA